MRTLIKSVLAVQILLCLAFGQVLNGPSKLSGPTRMGSTVSPALISLTLSPQNPTDFIGGTSLSFTALGGFSDTSTLDETLSATWTSSDPNTIAIPQTITNPLSLNCLAAGNVLVTAAVGAISGNTTVICTTAAQLSISSTLPASGTAGASYTGTLTASNNTGAVTWDVFAGVLPDALVLTTTSVTTATVTGTLSTPGTYPFTIRAQDSTGTALLQVTINVFPPITGSGNTAEFPRVYVDTTVVTNSSDSNRPIQILTPNIPAAAVTKKVCNVGDSQCPSVAGDYALTTAGINLCLTDGVTAGTEWECVVTQGSTTNGTIFLPNKALGVTTYTRLRSSGTGSLILRTYGPWSNMAYYASGGVTTDDAHRFKLLATTQTTEALDTAVPSGTSVPHHYLIYGLEGTTGPLIIGTAQHVTSIVTIGHNLTTQVPAATTQPHHIYVDNSHIHGITGADPASDASVQKGIRISGAYLAFMNSICDEVHMPGTESHCWDGSNGTGPVLIQNNIVRGGSINSMVGGSLSSDPNAIPSDYYIAGNWYSRDPRWNQNNRNWAIKNIMEVKIGQRFLIEGNLFGVGGAQSMPAGSAGSWADGQTGGCILVKAATTYPNQVTQDWTFRRNIVAHCNEFIDGLVGSASPTDNGASIAGNRFTMEDVLGYDISAPLYNLQSLSPQGRGLRWNGKGATFGNDIVASGTPANAQSRDSAGLTTVTLSTAAPDLRVGLPAILAGFAGPTFNGTFNILSVISAQTFTYQGAAASGTDTGGTVTLRCSAVSDTTGANVAISCPDTNCGQLSPCGGGTQISAGEFVTTLNCANAAFNQSSGIASATADPLSLNLTYAPVTPAPPSTTTSCSVLSHDGVPRYIHMNHLAIYGRETKYNMLTPDTHARDTQVKNILLTSETSQSLTIFTSGNSEGKTSQLVGFDVPSAEFHHILFSEPSPGSDLLKIDEYPGPGIAPIGKSTGISPPDMWAPQLLICPGAPDINCLGFQGNYAYGDPDAGAPISTVTGGSGTYTFVTQFFHNLRVGNLVNINITAPATMVACSRTAVPVVAIPANDQVQVNLSGTCPTVGTLATTGTILTGHDYHDFILRPDVTPSYYAGGSPGGADDCQCLGPRIPIIDQQLTNPSHPVAATGVPTADLNKNSLTFTAQTVGTTSTGQTFTLTNNGTADLTTISIQASGQFAQTSTCGTILTASGGTCTVTVTFSPLAPVPPTSRVGNVTINDNVGQQIVSLSGTAQNSTNATITFDRSPLLTFPSTAVGVDSASITVTLTNTGTTSATISSIAIITGTDYFFTANTCTSVITASGTCTVDIKFTPSISGTRTDTLRVSCNNCTAATFDLPITGLGTGPVIVVTPNPMAFGSQNTGFGVTKTMTIQNTGTSSATISSTSISAGGADYTRVNNCGGTLAAGASCTNSITFTPSTTGSRPGTFSVADNAPGNPHTASLTGTGVTGGAVTIFPSSITMPALGQVGFSCDVATGGHGCTFTATSGTITSDGYFTAPASGSVTVTATNGTSSANSTVTVSGSLQAFTGQKGYSGGVITTAVSNCTSDYNTTGFALRGSGSMNICNFVHTGLVGTMTRRFGVVIPSNYVPCTSAFTNCSGVVFLFGNGGHGLANVTTTGACAFPGSESSGWASYLHTVPSPAPALVCVEGPFGTNSVCSGTTCEFWDSYGTPYALPTQLQWTCTVASTTCTPNSKDAVRRIIFALGTLIHFNPKQVMMTHDWSPVPGIMALSTGHIAAYNADLVAVYANYNDGMFHNISGTLNNYIANVGPFAGQTVPNPVGPVSVIGLHGINTSTNSLQVMCGNNNPLTSAGNNPLTIDDVIAYWDQADSITTHTYIDLIGSTTSFCTVSPAVTNPGVRTTLQTKRGTGGKMGTEVYAYRMNAANKATPFCSFSWTGTDTLGCNSGGAGPVTDFRNSSCNSTTPCVQGLATGTGAASSTGYDWLGIGYKFYLNHFKP